MGDNAELRKESRQVVKVLEEKHAGVLDRLDSVEKVLGVSNEKHAKEQAARQKIEEVMKRKTQEQQKHNETQAELVDSLQRTVGIFDTLIRKDMDERKSEMKRLWEAVDGHTHDLSSKEEKSLRPSRFSRSSPSLGNATSTSARPVGASSSTRVVTYRPTVFPTTQSRVVSYPTTVVQATAPPVTVLQSKSEPEGRSPSPSHRKDHSEVVCGKARYGSERTQR